MNKTPLTTKTITEKHLSSLHEEACKSGDYAQVAICDLAIDGSFDGDDYTTLETRDVKRIARMTQEDALTECARVINTASANR